jgi:hypothetical protein
MPRLLCNMDLGEPLGVQGRRKLLGCWGSSYSVSSGGQTLQLWARSLTPPADTWGPQDLLGTAERGHESSLSSRELYSLLRKVEPEEGCSPKSGTWGHYRDRLSGIFWSPPET